MKIYFVFFKLQLKNEPFGMVIIDWIKEHCQVSSYMLDVKVGN